VELLLLLEFAVALVIAAGGSEKVASIVENEVRLPGAMSDEGAGVGSDIVVGGLASCKRRVYRRYKKLLVSMARNQMVGGGGLEGFEKLIACRIKVSCDS
jgi:hypothetical protein